MKSKVIWALVALNVLLLVTLVFRQNTATAQPAGLRRGQYVMISGEVQGGTSGIVYILDEANHMLAARTYDENKKQFFDMAPIPLDRVFQNAAAAPAAGGRK